MGVSSDTTDLTLLVSGGEAFANRITELKAAKESFDRSLDNLNLGKAARAAHDEAGRVLSEAKAKRDAEMAALNTELTNARNGLNIWVEETKAKVTAAYNEANQAMADAKAIQEAATAANVLAQNTLDKGKTEAASLVKDAHAEAADIIANAKKQADDILVAANRTEAMARKAVADADEVRAKYETAMGRIREAVV